MATTPRAEARPDGESASELISRRIAELGDWRGETLARVRAVIRGAAPEVAEAVKWRKPSNPDGVPVWECAGIVCTGDAFRDKVKVTFAKGAQLRTRRGCSTPASRATPCGPSTSGRATTSTRSPCKRSSAPPWR
jgi:hypothetical protein